MRQVSVPLKYVQIFLAGLIMLIVGIGAGYFIGVNRYDIPGLAQAAINRDVPNDKNVDFDLFWEIWDTMDAKYFDKSKLGPSKMVYGAIKGMVAAVGDPYTIFLSPSENKITQEDLQGNFEGVGIQIGYRGTQLAVIAPLPESPAEEAGVQAGDYIIGITDEAADVDVSTGGMTLPEAVKLIRGKANTEVKLTLLRDGSEEPIEAVIKRKTIDVPSVSTKYVGENEQIAHIRVLKFGGETKSEWEKAVLEIQKKENLKGIVLDLRNNPGGYMEAAIDLGSEFIEKGKVVVIEDRGEGQKTEFKSTRMGRLTKENVVVLVNGGSASASEILAGALRDQAGIKIFGTKTFGKGTVQEPLELKTGEGLHVTIARWLTPSGYWVHDKGLEPDTVVENNQDTVEDEQLEEAQKYLISN